MIYFDNAATTLMKPPEVAESVAFAINAFGGVGRGVHEASMAAGMAVYEAREKVARFFNAPSAKNVAFMANATEAINVVVAGLLDQGDHVITTAASHNSILRPLYCKQDRGTELSILPVSSKGAIDYAELESLFSNQTRLLIVGHASNVCGDVYDIGRIARICHEHGAICAVDVAQTAGHIPIDMQASEIDIVAFTGHKGLFGPQGTGGLCVNEGVVIPPLLSGGSGTHSYDRHHPDRMPECLEAGTLNSHSIAGLSAGLDFLERTGVDTAAALTDGFVKRFEAGIDGIEGLHVYGRQDGSAGCGIVALNIGDHDSAVVGDMLSTEFGICTRTGAHCAPLMHEALGTKYQGAVRFSFSLFNTEEEIDEGIAALRSIAAYLQGAEEER